MHESRSGSKELFPENTRLRWLDHPCLWLALYVIELGDRRIVSSYCLQNKQDLDAINSSPTLDSFIRQGAIALGIPESRFERCMPADPFSISEDPWQYHDYI